MEEAQDFEGVEGEVEFDQAEEWEVYGGKRVDQGGKIVSKYERSHIPNDFYKVYCIDDSQRGGT